MFKVLVIDDSPSELQLISGYLRQANFSVITADNGKEALKQIFSQKPDVVITDIVMPDMNGLELCRSLKKNPATQHMPIVACSSKDQKLDRLWALKQGVSVYLTKPCTAEELIAAVKSVAV